MLQQDAASLSSTISSGVALNNPMQGVEARRTLLSRPIYGIQSLNFFFDLRSQILISEN
jgi:hypothetical protein